MKERPILMSAAMVQAILAGTKSQTRRILKPQPKLVHALYPDGTLETERIYRDTEYRQRVPYGVPGDRLWVRETWRELGSSQLNDGTIYKYLSPDDVVYAADAPGEGPFRSPIFMPRTASRITLEILSIRVERLQEISEEDARAEGIGQPTRNHPCGDLNHPGVNFGVRINEKSWAVGKTARDAYRVLWESLHGPGSWEANPWVAAIEFKRVEVAS